MILFKKNTSNFLKFFVCILFTQLSFAQFTIPEKPDFQTSVYDYAKILEPSEKSQLEEKLIRYSDSTSTQIVVVTIESLQGEYIATLSTNWGQKWGVGGSKQTDNGIFILLAKAERKIWISPGYGVEAKLTAGIVGQLIRDVIVPEFKAGSYYNGLDKGTDAVFEVLQGEYKGERKQSSGSGFPILPIIIIVVIVFLIISRNKNNGGNSGNNSGGGPSLLDMIILSNLGRSSGGSFGGGFGGSSGGGGGFGGGFGGGGFSGGGAGGDW
jgi:uncharacterized protein